MTIRRLYQFAACYFLLLFLMITLPFTVAQINRIYPYVLGFPFFQFCIFLFIILNAAGLVILFLIEDRLLSKDSSSTTGDL